MNGFSKNAGEDHQRKFPNKQLLEGRMLRHVETRRFYLAGKPDADGLGLRYCPGGTPASAKGPSRFCPWIRLARHYNLVDVGR